MKVRPCGAAAALGAALLIAVAPGSAEAQAERMSHPRVRQAIDLLQVWLDAQRDYMQIPGMSVAVVHDQDIVWSGGFGFADVERQAPASPATLYSICSISKLFTAIGVMQQRDAGRLRLDDPLEQHLDWFRIRRTDPDAPAITLAGVLTHSAGLPRESAHAYWTGPDFVFPTREQVIDGLQSQETLYPADRYWQYSNLGISLAGEVVSAVSGMPYDEYIQRHVLTPLGLESTFSEMPEQHRGGRLATGYSAITRRGVREPVTFFQARGIAPAAGFASSVEDLARFASWQFRVLDGKGGDEVLRRNTLREMHRVHWVDPDFETMWGLGFAVQRRNGRPIVGHGGSCPGFRSNLILDPAEKVAAVVMANAQGVNTGQFAERIHDIIVPALKAAADTTRPARPVPQPDTTLARYVGNYETGFSGELAIVLWENGLAAVGLPTLDPLGGLTRLRSEGEHTFRRLRKDNTPGEAVVFETDASGRVTRLVWNNNVYRRTR